ncbi:hypothetical protein JSE7799_03396 [Jannaschia seosinensis]|uniref:Magnesium transporter MgtE intracellular domain-containing protein n=2 Tax=Jannaschia seosinensis TaxID=313367 RepID=A0A0M7BE36_9RHOB|nr:hypothetical protein JSE7799_03396 [Jannaschia seosinensis]
MKTKRFDSLRRGGFTILVSVLVLSALTRIVSASLAISDGAEPPDRADVALLCPPSDEISQLLQDLAQRDAGLTEREEAVAMREQDFTVARQEIEASLIRLAEAEARLEARMHRSKTAADEDVSRLVEVYEGMKPKDAAALFETMEPAFAAGFVARMNADTAANILTNLTPETAYALSVLMAGRNANAATE